MTPEHFSGVWGRLWVFICQMWLIFAAYLEGLCFKYQLLNENNGWMPQRGCSGQLDPLDVLGV